MRLSEPLAAGDATHAPALVRHQRITAHLLAASGAVAAPLAAHLDDARSSPPFLAAAHARACRRRRRRGRPGQRTPPAFGARARRHAPGGAAKSLGRDLLKGGSAGSSLLAESYEAAQPPSRLRMHRPMI